MESRSNKQLDQADGLRSEVAGMKRNSSSMPTRSELHANKKQKTKWKVKFPLIKLLSLFFILIPITIYAIYAANHQDDPSAVTSIDEVHGVETIEFNENEEITETEDTDKTDNQNETTTSDSKTQASPNTESDSQTSEGAESSSSEDEQQDGGLISKDSSEEDYNIVYHVVQPKETVFRIAMKYYKTQEGIELIKEWNNLKDNNIEVGQELKIPIKKQ
ncbi:LysM peptidoglycan-binding domain-containing protein [Peribacillus alkalitolerans]|uniref:LysM peptidoglycan-binding domain-containing protein n=1 Tax=Peribacillus alkalitolerans TaxID=1550385 RepID=UPI0013D0BD46|nr:LysM peptidoglycan-binding domain-containing protein [Peribacillus alkalitolerans]